MWRHFRGWQVSSCKKLMESVELLQLTAMTLICHREFYGQWQILTNSRCLKWDFSEVEMLVALYKGRKKPKNCLWKRQKNLVLQSLPELVSPKLCSPVAISRTTELPWNLIRVCGTS